MENADYVKLGGIGLLTAIICGKWAMELGYRQSRQLLWMIAGLMIPPLALLMLYVRQIRRFREQGKAGGRF